MCGQRLLRIIWLLAANFDISSSQVSLDGTWMSLTGDYAFISGSSLTHIGVTYAISDITDSSFRISNGWGGGSALLERDKIIAANGLVCTRIGSPAAAYEVVYAGKKLTCSDMYERLRIEFISKSECQAECDIDKSCGYWFYDEQPTCFTYTDCTLTQSPLYSGITYRKAHPPCLDFPRVIWATRAGGVDTDFASWISIVAGGGMYVSGFFSVSAVSPPPSASFGITTLKRRPGLDMFVMKVASTGEVESVTDAPVPKDAGVMHRRCFCSISGAIYETGRYDGEMSKGKGSGGTGDVFVTKHSATGEFQWTTYWGGYQDDAGTSITTDAFGDVYVTGHFMGVISVYGQLLQSTGTCAAFVVKLESATGNVIWVTTIEATKKALGYSIFVDPARRVYVTGCFEGTASFGGQNSLESAGGCDVFVAKFDSAGASMWAFRAGGEGDDSGNALAVDVAGHVYVAGSFTETAAFGATSLQSEGRRDIFVMKLSDVLDAK